MRLLLLLTVAVCAAGQPVPRNRLTFSGGWSREIGGYSFEQPWETSLGLSYGRRVWKYAEAEAGVFTVFIPGKICNAHGCVDTNDHILWVPFGARFIAPSFHDRLEVSAGGGGLWEGYRSDNPYVSLTPIVRTGWGGYFVGSAAVALDRGRRFWLGVTPRWFLANPPFARDRWFQVAAEASFRFK